MNLKDQLVNFRVRDAYIQEPPAVLAELHGDDILQGRVLTVSNNDKQDESYAVIIVQGIREPMVVPIRRILGVL